MNCNVNVISAKGRPGISAEISCYNRFRILFRKATTYMIGGLLVVIFFDLRQGRNSKLRAEVFVECCEIEVSQDLVNIIVIFAEGWDGQPTWRDWYLIESASHSSSDNWISQGWIASSWVRYTIVGSDVYSLITFYTILDNYNCSHVWSNDATFTNWSGNVVCAEYSTTVSCDNKSRLVF